MCEFDRRMWHIFRACLYASIVEKVILIPFLMFVHLYSMFWALNVVYNLCHAALSRSTIGEIRSFGKVYVEFACCGAVCCEAVCWGAWGVVSVGCVSFAVFSGFAARVYGPAVICLRWGVVDGGAVALGFTIFHGNLLVRSLRTSFLIVAFVFFSV